MLDRATSQPSVYSLIFNKSSPIIWGAQTHGPPKPDSLGGGRLRSTSREIEAQSRPRSRADVYAALQRLESKGLVSSWLGEATPERGGRAEKHFAITSKGLREARQTHRSLTQLCRGLPQFEGGKP